MSYNCSEKFNGTVSEKWQLIDYFGALTVRLSLRRSRYKVKPGLYAFGNPGKDSDVLVTANYKLTFDILRRNLAGLNIWILVLDTKGVNVWCAAGKGVFSTEELTGKIHSTHLTEYVNHRRLILPQLGASGIAAHQVKEQTGFHVVYGPVRASDIKCFISANYKASAEMRKVTFAMSERILLTPVEMVQGLSKFVIITLVAAFLYSINFSEGSVSFSVNESLRVFLFLSLAYVSGTFLTPVFLPWLPGRAFSLKGIIMGVIVFMPFYFLEFSRISIFLFPGWLFIVTAISSFLAMNFTGSSTFTSLSGVKKEMR